MTLSWNVTEKNHPDDNTLCEVITESGSQTRLLYYRGLWFFPDKSMYVYYTPLFWLPADDYAIKNYYRSNNGSS